MSYNHTSQHWTHLPQCEFIQLAMIEAQDLRRGGPEEDIIRLAQQGKIETILDRKESVNLCDLFPLPTRPLVVLPSPPPPPGRVCLVEGGPGGGKSTFALHICHQWAQGAPWLRQFDVVILAYLRDEAVQNAKTLADLLPASDTFENVASQITILFVFDGWDEFQPELMKNSLVTTIIREPHKLSLHQSTVLITSRPVSSGNLLSIADRRVEILGFTQHQIHEYIEKALNGNITHIQKLFQHFEEYPIIEGYCYVPLHAAIVLHVFLTMKGALPTTLHELFCSLVLCCIIREQVTREPNAFLPEFSSLDDLPNDLRCKVRNLSVLAYNGVMQNKVIFYLNDFKASHLPADLSSLGLLQAVEGLTLYSKSLSYNFLHLSVQELLAAYHISQLPTHDQLEIFKKMLNTSRFQAVLHYFSGFTKLGNPELQKIISSCQHAMSSIKDFLPLLHCIFEAQQPSLCKLIHHNFTSTKIEANDLAPIDFVVFGYFVSATAASSTTIKLLIHHIDDHRLKLLLSEFSRYPLEHCADSLSKRLVLVLYTSSITGQGAKHLAAELRQPFSVITRLTLYDCDIMSGIDGLLHIAEALQVNSSLTKLRLSFVNLLPTKQNGLALTKMLQMNKSLTHLDLSGNYKFSDSGAYWIFEGLQSNTSLVYLNLNGTGIKGTDSDTALSLTKMLAMNTSLTHLDLSNYYYIQGERLISSLFQGLEDNDTLRHLNVHNLGISDNEAPIIAQVLKTNNSLQTVDITSISLCDGIRLILESLQLNTTLKKLYVTKLNRKTEDAVRDFDRARFNRQLPSIDIVRQV